MPRDLPIACSLGAGDLSARLAELAAVGRAGLLRSDVAGGRARLHFDARVRERLDAVVAAEAECCAFLTMRLRDVPGGEVRLTIEAPAGAEPVMAELVAAFEAR